MKKFLNWTTVAKFRELSRTNKTIAVTVALSIAIAGFVVLATQAANFFATTDFSGASLDGTKEVEDKKSPRGKALAFGKKKKEDSSEGDSDGGTDDGTTDDGSTGDGSDDGSTGGDSGDGSTEEGTVTKPNSSTTGPRIAITRTLSVSEALAELRQTKYLSGVLITGIFRLSGSDGRGWVIEDSRFESRGGRYTIQSYVSLTSFTGTKAERPILRYVDIVGGAPTGHGYASSVVYGSDIVIEHADIYGGVDGIKSTGRMDIINSWVRDNDHPSGAHCDSIQIRSGTDILIKGSRFDGYVGYSSDNSGGTGFQCNRVLQTGSVIGHIQARFEDNWFAGGHYTIGTGGTDTNGYTVDYVFRNNKWMRNGTSVTLNRTDLPPHTYGPLTGAHTNDMDSSNVWEDTGEPVKQ